MRVTSAGTGGWHAGDPADQRANHVLREHGYPSAHRAAQIDDEHLSADLVVALGRNHVRMLRELGVPARTRSGCCGHSIRGRVRTPSTSKTRTTAPTTISRTSFTVIEAALPGLHDWVDEQLAGRGIAS